MPFRDKNPSPDYAPVGNSRDILTFYGGLGSAPAILIHLRRA